MLPEHVQMIHDLWKEDGKKTRPILDEQEIEEINLKLQCAIHNDLTVEIKYFRDRDFLTRRGKLRKIDALQRRLQLEDRFEIALEEVLDVYVD